MQSTCATPLGDPERTGVIEARVVWVHSDPTYKTDYSPVKKVLSRHRKVHREIEQYQSAIPQPVFAIRSGRRWQYQQRHHDDGAAGHIM